MDISSFFLLILVILEYCLGALGEEVQIHPELDAMVNSITKNYFRILIIE